MQKVIVTGKQEIDNQVMSNSPLGKPVFSANNQAAPTPKIGYRVRINHLLVGNQDKYNKTE